MSSTNLQNEVNQLKKQNRRLFAENGEMKERVKNMESCVLDILDVLVNTSHLKVGSAEIIADLNFMRETSRRYNPQKKLPL